MISTILSLLLTPLDYLAAAYLVARGRTLAPVKPCPLSDMPLRVHDIDADQREHMRANVDGRGCEACAEGRDARSLVPLCSRCGVDPSLLHHRFGGLCRACHGDDLAASVTCDGCGLTGECSPTCRYSIVPPDDRCLPGCPNGDARTLACVACCATRSQATDPRPGEVHALLVACCYCGAPCNGDVSICEEPGSDVRAPLCIKCFGFDGPPASVIWAKLATKKVQS